MAVLCFELGTVATVALATIVVTLAAAECYAALRRGGRRPATLLGLVATVAVMVAAYAKGLPALPLVLVLVVITAMVWYLVGVERGSTVEGVASTLLGFVWVGFLGSFAALLLAPGEFPHRHGIAFLLGAIVATIGADVGALAIGSWLGRHHLAPDGQPQQDLGRVDRRRGRGRSPLSAAITGQVHPWTVPKAALLGLVVAVVAPIGDLCESLVKRDLGLKDMGSILPGPRGRARPRRRPAVRPPGDVLPRPGAQPRVRGATAGPATIDAGRLRGRSRRRAMKVSLVGSTGSIGTQAVEVMTTEPDRFTVVGLAAWRSVEVLGRPGPGASARGRRHRRPRAGGRRWRRRCPRAPRCCAGPRASSRWLASATSCSTPSWASPGSP